MQNILFPIFTNGTYMNELYLKLFDKCRNLIPVMSIEGGKEITDERRGEGVYDKLIAVLLTADAATAKHGCMSCPADMI